MKKLLEIQTHLSDRSDTNLRAALSNLIEGIDGVEGVHTVTWATEYGTSMILVEGSDPYVTAFVNSILKLFSFYSDGNYDLRVFTVEMDV